MKKRTLNKLAWVLLYSAVLGMLVMMGGWITGVTIMGRIGGGMVLIGMFGSLLVEMYIDKKFKKEA